MYTTSWPSSTRAPRARTWGRIRSAFVAFVVAMGLAMSATPAASVGLGSPATLDEVLASAGYDQPHADVLRLYQAFFEREPDVEGAVYWIGQYEAGATLDDLAFGFAQSTEFINRYGGNLTDREFLEIVYGNVLGRTPDGDGMDYWLSQIEGGLSQHGVVRWVAANDEFAVRHPFTPTIVDLSPSTFINLADLPPDWTVAVSIIDLGTDRTACEDRLTAPDNTVFASFESPGGVDFLEQGLAVFDSVAKAENYLELIRGYAASCTAFLDVRDDRIQPGPLSVRAIGDSSASIRETVTTAGTTDTYERHLVAWRVGRVLSIVWTSAEVGEPPTDLNIAIDIVESRLLADIS